MVPHWHRFQTEVGHKDMDNKSKTKHTYNVSAQAMAEKFNAIGPRIKDISRAFFYVQKDNPAVFEIGCGNGRDAKEIIKHSNNYLGIDYSAALLTIARAELPKTRFELADIELYHIPKNLDVIFSFASLLHSSKEAVKDILARSHDALNLGGIFFISLKYAPYREEAITDAWGTRVFYFYTPEEIKALAGENYTAVYEHTYTAKNGQQWFEIILQK